MESHPIDARILLDHAEWIGRLARSLVRDEHEAEDLVQETWLAALRSRPDEARTLRPWLGHVLRNFVRQRIRRDARCSDSGSAGESVDDLLPSAADLAERAELSARLVRAVLSLPEPQRSTVLLRYYEGLPSSEIARRQRLPAATVRSRLKRALDAIRTRLDGSEGDRDVWTAALLPLIHPGGWTKGTLAVKWNTKVGVALGFALLTGVGTAPLWWATPPESDSTGGDDEPAPLERPAPDVASGVQLAPSGPAAPRAEVAREKTEAAPERTRAPFAAFLIDADTGEAVPSFEVRVDQEGRSERLVSDEVGRLESSLAFEAGPLELRYDDHAGVPRNLELAMGSGTMRRDSADRIVFDPAAPERELLIEVGPTYLLELLAPRDIELADLSAAILGLGDGWREFFRAVTSTPLRAGARDWVRFAALPAEMLPRQGPWRLEVRSADGFWIGAAEVDSIRGVHDELVRVDLLEQGRLSGRVLDETGRPLEGISVVVSGEHARASAESDADGSYGIQWLAAGDYRLRATSPRHRPTDARIAIRPGEETRHTVAVEWLPRAGAVAGVLTSTSGRYANGGLDHPPAAGGRRLPANLSAVEARARRATRHVPVRRRARGRVHALGPLLHGQVPVVARPPARGRAQGGHPAHLRGRAPDLSSRLPRDRRAHRRGDRALRPALRRRGRDPHGDRRVALRRARDRGAPRRGRARVERLGRGVRADLREPRELLLPRCRDAVRRRAPAPRLGGPAPRHGRDRAARRSAAPRSWSTARSPR